MYQRILCNSLYTLIGCLIFACSFPVSLRRELGVFLADISQKSDKIPTML